MHLYFKKIKQTEKEMDNMYSVKEITSKNKGS